MLRLTILLILFVVTVILPQDKTPEAKNVFSARAGFVTSSRLYLNPSAAEQEIRNRSFDIDNILFPSIEYRYPLSSYLFITAAIDYVSATAYGRNITVITDEGTATIEIKDGYHVLISEASLYYILPFSTADLTFFMAGGGGLYLASGVREIGDIRLNGGSPDPGTGIHVFVGMEYKINEFAQVAFTMKFRNPDVVTSGEYSSLSGIYNGRRITLAKRDYKSRISIDGTVFMLGLNLSF